MPVEKTAQEMCPKFQDFGCGCGYCHNCGRLESEHSEPAQPQEPVAESDDAKYAKAFRERHPAMYAAPRVEVQGVVEPFDQMDVELLKATIRQMDEEIAQLARYRSWDRIHELEVAIAQLQVNLQAQVDQAFNEGVEAAAVCVAQAVDAPKAGDIVRKLKRAPHQTEEQNG